MMDVSTFLQHVGAWAGHQPGVTAVYLVGSHARGDPSSSSDIDLVVLAEDPERFIRDQEWASTFGTITRSQVEEWGRVTSLRIWYADGLEAEFGLTDPGWNTETDDEETRAVIEEGYRVLYVRD